MNASRNLFWLWVLKRVAKPTPYLWGGKSLEPVKGKGWRFGGLDCSGLVTAGLLQAGGPDWRDTHNTDALWRLPRVELPDALPGDVVLYWGNGSKGPEDVEHAMVWAGAGVVVGQAYGGSANVTVEYSLARGHVSQALPLRYRPDFAGVVRLPFTQP